MMNVVLENLNGWRYSSPAPHKTGAGIATPMSNMAHNRASAVFLRAKHSHIRIMVGRAGQPQGWPGSMLTGCCNPVRLTTHEIATSRGELYILNMEAATMATALTLSHPEVTIENGRAVTTSVAVAEYFRKMHKDVLKKIDNLDCSTEFTERNFAPSEYTDSTGRKLPMYQITKNGFVFLVMGFTGKKAAAFKEAYIAEFDRMENELHQQKPIRYVTTLFTATVAHWLSVSMSTEILKTLRAYPTTPVYVRSKTLNSSWSKKDGR